MKKDRFKWMLAVGLLGLLGFSSCSPKLRMRRADARGIDTLIVKPVDSMGIKPIPNPNPGEFPPAKLMYGVPPGRFERIDLQNKEVEKTEIR